jgi:hypothetical protein
MMDEFAFWCTVYKITVSLMKLKLVVPFLLSTTINIFFMTTTAKYPPPPPPPPPPPLLLLVLIIISDEFHW